MVRCVVLSHLDAALAHELADCLGCVLTLADAYDVDLAAAFDLTMNALADSLTGLSEA